MANEVNIKVNVETQDLKKGMREVTNFGKQIETDFKRGKISAQEAGNAINKMMIGIDELGQVVPETTNALATLWHQQNRIGLGFKSLATETVGARQQFRDMFQEQRTGNRIMSEMAGTVKNLSSAFGAGGLGGTMTTIINTFQSTEFAINSTAIAASNAGGKMGSFGASLLAVAGPLTAVTAGLTYAISSWNALADAATKAGLATSGAYMTGAEKRLQATDPAGYMSALQGRRAGAASAASAAEGRFQSWKSQSGISTAGQYAARAAKEAYKEWQDALKERIRLDDLIWEAQQKEKKTGVSLGTAAPMPEDMVLTPEAARRNTTLGMMQGRGQKGYVGSGGQIKMGVEGPDLIRGVQKEVSGLTPALTQVGEVLKDSLTMGFVKGFQEGKNVLDTFTQSVLASMAAIAAQQAAAAGIAGILSLIPGVGAFGTIFGALGGLFGGSSSSSVAQYGPARPESSGSGTLVEIKDAIENLNLRVDNQGLYMASERGKVAFQTIGY